MSEEELFLDRFPFKLLASLITPLGAFPVDRRLPVDRRAVSYTVDRLAEGGFLILAPECGTERGWGLLPFRSGFVLLALFIGQDTVAAAGETGRHPDRSSGRPLPGDPTRFAHQAGDALPRPGRPLRGQALLPGEFHYPREEQAGDHGRGETAIIFLSEKRVV